MTLLTRVYKESDREWVAEKLGGTAAIDAKGNRIEIVEDGADRGLAIWLETDTPILGVVDSTSREMFYAALLAVIEALVEKDYKTGTATIRDKRVMLMLKRDLGDTITITPVGRNTVTDEVGSWRIDVVPAEVVYKLRGLV